MTPEIWSEINRCKIDRHSFVLAIGGGAFLEFFEGKVLPAVAMLEERAKA